MKIKANMFWIIACLAAGMLGALVAVRLFGQPVYKIGPLSVKMAVIPSVSGKTVVSVPPLGRMTAGTHHAPLKLTASVEEMDVDAVRKMIVARPKASEIMEQTRRDAAGAFASFAVRVTVLAFLGGGILAFAVATRRRHLAALLGALSGVGTLGLVAVLAAVSFDPTALMEPRYEGALRSAPWMVKLVRQGFFHLDSLDTELRSAAANLASLEGEISALAPVENGGPITKILLVSDLHNNTTAMRIVSDLAQAFNVSMVLNAGDLTDFGTPFEKSMSAVMGEIPKPHVFIGGNHDSPQTLELLKRLPNTRLPDEGLVKVEGLSVFGQSDPSASSRDTLVSSPVQIERSRQKLLSRYRRLRTQPDIILVHSPMIAKDMVGRAPVVVHGDDHRMHIKQMGETVLADPGTTGASGIRYFKQGSPKDITAIVLYISKTPRTHAIAADMISIKSPRGEFDIQRKRFVNPQAHP